MREYVIHQHSEDELRSKQMDMVELLLTARPKSGFRAARFVASGTVEGYVARHLHHHMKAALMDGETPPYDWLAHRDEAVVASVSMGLGRNAMDSMIAKAEGAGEFVIAARLSWAVGLLVQTGRLSTKDESEYVYNALDLLGQTSVKRRGYLCFAGKRVNDEDTRIFEMRVLAVAALRDFGTERHLKAHERQRLQLNPPPTMGSRVAARLGNCIMESPTCHRLLICLMACQAASGSGEATFESKINEGVSIWLIGMTKWGFLGGPRNKWPNPIKQHREEALIHFRQCCSVTIQARELTEDPIKRAEAILSCAITKCNGPAFSELEEWKIGDFVTEDQLVEAIASYDFVTYSPVSDMLGVFMDIRLLISQIHVYCSNI